MSEYSVNHGSSIRLLYTRQTLNLLILTSPYWERTQIVLLGDGTYEILHDTGQNNQATISVSNSYGNVTISYSEILYYTHPLQILAISNGNLRQG